MQVANDKVVLIEYTMTDPEGEVLETTEGDGPLAYLHGSGGILPGLEDALLGRAAGDEFHVELKPDDAFGDYDEELVEALPRADFEEVDDLEIGMEFECETDDGPEIVTVIGIDDEEVSVDRNHPLAGVAVKIAVRVIEVREATAEELEHGHVHGAGGCEHGPDADGDEEWDDDDWDEEEEKD